MDFTLPGVPGVGSVISGNAAASSMAYHEEGKWLYVASEGDAKLQVIDCLSGKAAHAPLKAEREQIDLVEATHHEQSVLIAGKGNSTQPIGQRHAINYWSLHDNKVLRKFKGHSDKVTTISMCPADDSFLSSSLGGSVRLWNLQQAGCLEELKLPGGAETTGPPIAAFDATGLVFCVSAAMANGAGHCVHLYDARNSGGGAFAEMKVPQADLERAILAANPGMDAGRAGLVSRAPFRSIKFNVSGSSILVGSEMGMSLVLDGFEGTIQKVFVDASRDRAAVSCFTPDDKTIMSGNEDGTITCFDVDSGTVVQRLKGLTGPVNCVLANPKYAQLASACSQIALWTWPPP